MTCVLVCVVVYFVLVGMIVVWNHGAHFRAKEVERSRKLIDFDPRRGRGFFSSRSALFSKEKTL